LVFVRASSSLVRRIVVLNLAGLVAMLAGILYLNQFRAGLIEARVQSLKIQGERLRHRRPWKSIPSPSTPTVCCNCKPVNRLA
jgi:hypothetical protein